MITFGTSVSARGATGYDVTLARMDATVATDLGDSFAQMSPWNQYPMTAATLTHYFASEEAGAPRYLVRLASGAETAIGVLGIRENWLRGPYIQFLGLVEAYQRHAIGEALLGHVETAARQQRAQNLWVMASQFNDRAIAFYERSGFFPVSDIDALVSPDHSEVLLRKRLR